MLPGKMLDVVLMLLVMAFALLLSGQVMALTENYTPIASDYIFYTFAISGILFSGMIIIAYREFKWLVYVGFSLLLVLNGASMDGTLAYYLGGGEFAVWVVPFLIFSSTAVYGYIVIALRLEAPHKLARLRRLCLFLALLTAIFPLSSFFWLRKISLAAMWVPVNILFFTMLIGQMLPPITWSTPDPLQRLLTRAFPVVVGLCATAIYVVQYFSDGFSRAQLNVLDRATLLLFASFSMAIVIWQAVANLREKDAAERRALEAARSEAEVQLALTRAEAGYEEAKNVASQHRSRLASVSHDLKQPISALRVAINNIQQADSDAGAVRLSRAVEYIDSLAHSYIDEGLAGAEAGRGESGPDAGPVREVVSTRVFARTLAQMFAGQAGRESIRLIVREPGYDVHVDPLSTMRIMSNLINNALTHSTPRRLLVGFRVVGKNVLFQVHDDGIGMDEEALANVCQLGVKASSSDGHGLGLGIVHELCLANNLEFYLASTPGRGTSAYVSLPRG